MTAVNVPAYVAVRRFRGKRSLAHGLVLGVIVASTLGLGVVRQTTVGDTSIPSAEDALVVLQPAPPANTAPMVAPAHIGIEPDPAPRQALFVPAVERWRPLTQQTTQVVQRLTGVALHADLLLALVAVESEGQPTARSDRGAVGLTQIEPTTFEDLRARYSDVLAEGSIDQPRSNLLAGALYLAVCARTLGADLADRSDLVLVLHAYNLGPRAAGEWRDNGTWLNMTTGGVQVERELPSETVAHAARIMAALGVAPV